ncbi:MAG TPA: hypothetical protein VIX37_04875 [Candidatus Sulfotelmatobacter sp.]
MKNLTQAWGWLVAAVLAAGLNASYHNGGLQWAHQIAERVEQGSTAVLAQASGHANQFLAEARLLTAPTETASCPLTTTMARVQSRIAGSETAVERFDVMSAREERQLARLAATRARMEARIQAQTAHIKIATAAFGPIAVKAIPDPVVCPRVRVNIPRMPMIKMPVMPQIHVETGSSGPV